MFATGLLVRLFFVAYVHDQHGDSELYEAMATHLVGDGTFALTDSSPTIVRPPGYPLFVAAVYSIAGRSPEYVLLVQAFLGATTGVLLFALLRRIVTQPLAGFAASLAAASPELAYYASTILTETLLTAALLLFVYCAYVSNDIDSSDAASFRLALHAGIVAGAAILITPRLVAAPLVGAAAFLVNDRPMRWKRAIACVTAAGLVVLPWSARNYWTFGTFSPSVQTSARMLWLAAKRAPADDWRLDPLFRSDPLLVRYGLVLDDREHEQSRIGERLALERQVTREAVGLIAKDPESYLRDRAKNYPRLWFDSQAHVVMFSGPLFFAHQHRSIVELAKSHRYFAAALRVLAKAVFFWAPAALVALGLFVALPQWKRHLAPYLLMAWVGVSAAPLFIEHRFTVPLHPVMTIFAAIALKRLTSLRPITSA